MNSLKRLLCLSALSCALWNPLSASEAQAYTLKNEGGQEISRQVQAKDLFVPRQNLGVKAIDTSPQQLAQVAAETLSWLKAHPDAPVGQAGILGELGVSRQDVLRSLELIVNTEARERKAVAQGKPSSLLNQNWLKKHFKLYLWKSDRQGAASNRVKLPDHRLRITKYVVFEAQGRAQRDKVYNQALYRLPPDEIDLSDSQAEAQKSKLIRYRYTKQDVVRGALQKHGVQPLVWLTRQGLEDALMQGSILVSMPNGQKRMFNVHRNNGIGYDRRIQNPRAQKRYWYFKEVPGILGYGQDEKIQVQPQVTFAGDVQNIGLGKLIAIRYPGPKGYSLRLGVLADTGGAFVPNLYQLDYLAGVFPNREAYRKGVAGLPTHAETYILIAR